MFKFLKKDPNTIFHAVASGTLLPLSQVNDQVFSTKMLGDGFAVEPTNGEIFSPVKGKIVSVFPTKHAISIVTKSGLEILIHMGIDTVELAGKPFEILITEGQDVTPTTLLAKMDLAELAKTNTPATTMVVVTNMDIVKNITAVTEKEITASEEVLTVEV